MRQRKTARTLPGGFGLTEALVVMFLIAVVALITIPLSFRTVQKVRREGAARRVLGDIRIAQSLAATRSGVYAWQWGPDAGRSESEFRVVRDDASCSFPPVDAPRDNDGVIIDWYDLSRGYKGMTVESVVDDGGRTVGGVMFDPLGASVNPCDAGVRFPVRITLGDGSGPTEVIVVRSAGGTSLQ